MSQHETRKERRAREHKERKERKISQRRDERARPITQDKKSSKGAYLLCGLFGVIIALVAVKIFSLFGEPVHDSIKIESSSGIGYGDVLTLSAEQVSGHDMATLNLVCGSGLNGTEHADIDACSKRLKEMTVRVKEETSRNWNRWKRNPAQYQNSLAHFKMGMLITVVREDFKTTYNPELIISPQEVSAEDGFFKDANNIFLQGLLTDKRTGTCASMPVLYVAIARKLGYPVYLVSTKGHLFCRWDGEGERMNFEGTGNGISINPDEYYHSFPYKLTPHELSNTSYLKNLTRAQELAIFLDARAKCLVASSRNSEAFVAMAQALRIAESDGLEGLAESLAYEGILPSEVSQMRNYRPNSVIPQDPRHFDVQKFNEMNMRRVRSNLSSGSQNPQYPYSPPINHPSRANTDF